MCDQTVVQVGDTFDDCYRSEYRRVLALAVVLCRDRHEAEDLTQDAFVALHRNWERISGFEDPGAWVRRVVANRSVSRWRRLRTEARGLVRLGRQEEAEWPDPDAAAVWSEVRRLSVRQAQVIALTYLDGLAVSEVARILAINDATVKTHLQRGRRALAEVLRETDGDDLP
jgi:RNA polymerase sigma factor (sigma-70 family)